MPEIPQIIEALIFASDVPVRPDQILELWSSEVFAEQPLDGPGLEFVLAGLEEKYQSEEHVFELRQINGGYQFFTKRDFYPFVRQSLLEKNKRKLSRASLETLSIIAYRQPVAKTELEFIRGVNCDYAVRKLLDQKLIEIQGRSDAPGRPLLYGTSAYFMEYFGLNDVSDLPKLEEVSIDEETFQGQFKIYLKESGAESPADGESAAQEG